MSKFIELFMLALLLIVLCIALAYGQKKEVPLCEKYTAYYFERGPGGVPGIWIDLENMQKLIAILRGLQFGTCRLDFDEERPASKKGVSS